MDAERKSVQIYLRVKGPLNPLIKPQFKLLADDTKIRFKQQNQSEQQQIASQFAGHGIYRFEKIFREDCLQEDIYKRVAQDLVQSAIEGYNGTIFAYGQTGSGKTYTMTGGDDDPSQMGIIPRVINDLYKQAQIRQEQITIKLRYMQIYKKHGYDLLHENSKAKKLEQLPRVNVFCKADNFQFENLSQKQAPTFEQAMKIYEYGDKNRIVCKTPSNDQSSRSHCILMILVKTKNKDTGLQQKATINLVDLAGSERVHHSQMEQKQAKQGISINLGLHYLSRVVLSLGEQSKGKEVYVPYRDSLLTMALKSSMGGNCKTRMIATINPNPLLNPQNISTCKFSQNLLAMQNKLKKNQFINPWDIIKGLKNQVQELKGQISRLKGENVKQILQRSDYVQIRKMVDQFISSQVPVTTLPINDRLYIREYLSYMKSIIRTKLKANRKGQQQMNEQAPNQNYETAVSQTYILQIKNMKQQIQQKQNQIQLLLSIINHKKQEHSQDLQDNVIAIQEVTEQKIAQTVVNTLTKDKKRKAVSITVQEVEKNLIKPIILNKQQSVQQAFKKFKLAHIKSQNLDQNQNLIKIKSMKKDVLQKKIKNMKYQRNQLSHKINQLQSTLSQPKPLAANLPSLNSSSQQPNEQAQVTLKQLKNQLQQLDSKIRKKYQELKSMELEINRLDLCLHKNNHRLRSEFEEYMDNHLRNKYEVQGAVPLHLKGKEDQQDLEDMDIQIKNQDVKNIFGKQYQKQLQKQAQKQKDKSSSRSSATRPSSSRNDQLNKQAIMNSQKIKSNNVNKMVKSPRQNTEENVKVNAQKTVKALDGDTVTLSKPLNSKQIQKNRPSKEQKAVGLKKDQQNNKLSSTKRALTNNPQDLGSFKLKTEENKSIQESNFKELLEKEVGRHMQQFFEARKELLNKIKAK